MLKEKLYIIKIGGNVIDDPDLLEKFLSDFSGLSYKKLLIHGGGKIASAIGDKLGIKSQYINGRRITDDATIDLVTMVYGGLVNKKIVAKLQAINCDAIGLSGADGNILRANKRPSHPIDFGWVGDVVKNQNDELLKWLTTHGFVPVVAPLTHDGKGNILNTNADTIASEIASMLSISFDVHLIFCFEKKGVLKDSKNDDSVLPLLTYDFYNQLKNENALHDGILPKIDNAFHALRNGIANVTIGNAMELTALINGNGGTKFLLS